MLLRVRIAYLRAEKILCHPESNERIGAFLVSLIPICNLTSSLRMDVEDICQSIQVV